MILAKRLRVTPKFCAVACVLSASAILTPSYAVGTDAPEPAVELSDTQLKAMKVESAGTHAFPQEQQAVGTIDFNQELLAQVFTNYQGRILKTFASVADRVKRGQVLFTIDSPDLVQAESTLISTAGVLELTSRNLERQRSLYKQSAAAQRDYEQSISDQQAAEGSYRAARAAVSVFGKSDADIDKILADRKIDATLVVTSPIDGLITARNAAPGLFVQPGTVPATYTVADTSTMWMLAYVPEKDASRLITGQEVKASVASITDKVFLGKIVTVGATIDPNSRRIQVRANIPDPDFELRAGMFATFVITIAPPKTVVALPLEAVVREGDGTMTVWVTTDRRKFSKRLVKTGSIRDGFIEITAGLQAGELVVTDGSLFLANQLTIAAH